MSKSSDFFAGKPDFQGIDWRLGDFGLYFDSKIFAVRGRKSNDNKIYWFMEQLFYGM